MALHRSAAILCLLAGTAAVADEIADLAGKFGALPDVSMLRLSPDGQRLAMQIPRNGAPAIMSVELASGKNTWLLATTPGSFKIVNCDWVKNDRLICLLEYTAMRQMQPYYEFSVVSLAADGSGAKEVLKKEPWVRLVNRLPNDPRQIAVEKLSSTDWPAIYLVDVYTGKDTQLVPAKPPVAHWELSDAGTTAVGMGLRGTGWSTLNYQQPEIWLWRQANKQWLQLKQTVPGDPYLELVGLDSAAQHALLVGSHQGRSALLALPLDGNSPLVNAISDDQFDVVAYDAQPALTNVAGRAIVERETRVDLWLDPALRQLQLKLDAGMPAAQAAIETASDNFVRMVVRFGSDQVAPVYVLFDSKTSQSRLLGKEYPALEGHKLAATRVVRIKMRDGTEIDAFLTEPVSHVAGPRKAIVLPHGGPEARDIRGFDFLLQFLAARGYRVLQPNFRGSTGYGREFLLAGRQSWGQAMHNDITDSAQWLLDNELADAGHLGIVGASYGGYAALLGVSKEPQLYSCAVSIAGPSDLSNLIYDFDKDSGPRGRRMIRNRIGWDRSELAEQSPLRLAANIKVPVLLVHGKLDTRVEPDHSERMAKALQQLGKPVRLVIQKNGDHLLSDERQRIELLTELGRFLDARL